MKEKQKKSTLSRVLDVIGLIICIIALPVVIINMSMMIKAWVNPNVPPSFMGHIPLFVESGSMAPTINVEDLLVVKVPDDASPLEEGTIVSYMTGDVVVTHRIVGVEYTESGDVMYVTKGDANNTVDNVRVSSSQIVGVYVNHFDGLGTVALYMQSTTGRMLFFVLPMTIAFLYFYISDHIRYKHSEKKYRELLAQQNDNEVESISSSVNSAE